MGALLFLLELTLLFVHGDRPYFTRMRKLFHFIPLLSSVMASREFNLLMGENSQKYERHHGEREELCKDDFALLIFLIERVKTEECNGVVAKIFPFCHFLPTGQASSQARQYFTRTAAFSWNVAATRTFCASSACICWAQRVLL